VGGPRQGLQLNGGHGYVFMGWGTYRDMTTDAVTPVAKVYNPWGVIPDDPSQYLNRPNVLYISEADWAVFTRAIGLKES